MKQGTSVVIIGGGPAGLSAALTLAEEKVPVSVLEADPIYLGGIARTVRHGEYLTDIGGHRFFSKSREIEDFWSRVLGDDLLERPRSSRILFRGKLFSYPLRAIEVLRKIGYGESLLCIASYIKSHYLPVKPAKTFEDWVVNRFGKRLFQLFFKTYTEKVWGIPCDRISADWAAQRINSLSLGVAILNALSPWRNGSKKVKTLLESFRYPRKGPGMMWEVCAEKIVTAGGTVALDSPVDQLTWDSPTSQWTVEGTNADGVKFKHRASHVISTMPLSALITALRPPASELALAAARSLRYRDFITISVIVEDGGKGAGDGIFQENWLYIHDPSVKVGRIQNYKSWSPEMVPAPTSGQSPRTFLGVEYFCFKGDGLWQSSDQELIALAKKELLTTAILKKPEQFIEGFVNRQEKAYPVYDEYYQEHVRTIRDEIASRYPGLHVSGRNGMHKYNNQDHAMMTGILAAKNIIAGENLWDVWRVNQDAEYLEHRSQTGGLIDPPVKT